jgi:hypothetical protein
MFNDETGGAFIAQTGAGNQCVCDMLVMRVGRIQYGGDAALCPVAGAVEQRTL